MHTKANVIRIGEVNKGKSNKEFGFVRVSLFCGDHLSWKFQKNTQNNQPEKTKGGSFRGHPKTIDAINTKNKLQESQKETILPELALIQKYLTL